MDQNKMSGLSTLNSSFPNFLNSSIGSSWWWISEKLSRFDIKTPKGWFGIIVFQIAGVVIRTGPMIMTAAEPVAWIECFHI